jgi:hypothetical protein
MAQTLHWIIIASSATVPADDAAGAAQIVAGTDGTGAAAAAYGQEPATRTPGANTVDEATPPTTLSPLTEYRIVATTWDGAGTYGGGGVFRVVSSVFTTSPLLAPADATHGHAAESPTLEPSLSYSLTVGDALHAHAAESPALTTRAAIAAASASHAHSADAANLVITTVTSLAVDDAQHDHTAGDADLIARVTLTAADAQHEHTADTVALGGASLTQPGRRVVRAEPRTRTVDNIPEPHMRPKTLDAIDIDEFDTVTFDYGRLLAPAETLLSATVSCATASGTDEDAATRLQGAPVVQPRRVLQRVSGGLSGVTYHLRSVAATSENRTLTLPALLPCKRM